MNERGLYQRGQTWWICYSDKSGKTIRESTGQRSKKLAREILSKKRTLVAEGRHLNVKEVPRTTFHQLCDQYWDIEGRLKLTKGLKQMIEIWKEGLGDVPLKELTQQKIEKYLNDRMEKKEIGAAGRNRHLAMLSSLFNKGIEWAIAVKNPTKGITKLREKGARTRYLDQDEVARLLDSASEDLKPILLAALHTGMRRGEIFNLRWQDVDLKGGIITVQESKSGKRRQIPLDDTLRDTLKKLPSRFKKGFVFPAPKSGKRRYDIKRAFRSALKRAELENVRFHDLRHSFASHLVMNGVDIKTVQELLGHQSLVMTMKYSHLAPDHRLRAIKTLDQAYRKENFTITSQSRNSGNGQSL